MASPAELPPWLANSISVEWAVKLILYYLFGATPPATPGAGILTTPGGGVQRVLTSTSVSASGSVSAGAKSVSFLTSSDWVGTVNGATLAASVAFPLTPPNPADILPAIAYTRSAGTIRIDVLT